jgi:Undecaprenyl-phosphate galactose phosphotransferase WbaP
MKDHPEQLDEMWDAPRTATAWHDGPLTVALRRASTPAPALAAGQGEVYRSAALHAGVADPVLVGPVWSRRPAGVTTGKSAMARFRLGAGSVRLVALPLLLGDMAAVVTSVLTAAAVTRPISHLSAADVAAVTAALCVPIAAGNLLTGLYPGVALNPAVEFRQLSRVAFISLLGTAALACLGGPLAPLWLLLLLAVAAPVQFFMAPFARSAVRAACRHRSWWGYPTIIFGGGDAAATVVRNLLRHPQYGLRPVLVLDGHAPGDERGRAAAMDLGVPRVGRPRLAATLAKRFKIRHAIVVLPDWSRADVTRILERYTRGIPHVTLTSAISPFSPGLPMLWRDPRDLAGVAGTEVRNRLLVRAPRVIKRTMDLTLTLVGGACLLPLLAVIAVLVKLTTPGPAFFGHTRIGLRGQRFKAWKFRSMVRDGADVLRRHLEANPAARAEWELDHKLRDDPRVTRVGAFLRKTSLDELPQLWNVLRGDMSLVGPRPIVDDEVAKYGKYYAVYKSVRPGITGLWQVSGRNDTTYDERLGYDEFYVRNWSPWLDMHLLARTVAALCCTRGAY